MQLQEVLPKHLQESVAFGGGVKEDGTWHDSSLFNNVPFRKEMNGAYIKGLDLGTKMSLRAKLKENYKRVACSATQMDEVRIHQARSSTPSKACVLRCVLALHTGQARLLVEQVQDRAPMTSPHRQQHSST
jgi:hypothetical protein